MKDSHGGSLNTNECVAALAHLIEGISKIPESLFSFTLAEWGFVC